MKSVVSALRLLTPPERKSAFVIMVLISIRGFADMVGVAMVFPFLNIIGKPEIIETNKYLAWGYQAGGFSSIDQYIFAIGLAFFGILIATAALKIATVYLVNRWLEGRIHSISSRLLEGYLRQPYEFMLGRHTSSLVTNMLSEVSRLIVEVYKPITDIAVAIVTIGFIVILLLVVDPVVTLLVIGVLGGLFGTLFLVIRTLATRLGGVIVDNNRERYRVAWEALAGGKQVRLQNREATIFGQFLAPSLRLADASALSRLMRQAPRYVIEVLAVGGTLLLTLALMNRGGGVGSEALGEALPVLGLFALAGYRMMPALQNGYQSFVSLRVGAAALDAISKDLEQVENLPELPRQHIEPLRFDSAIELKNVTYSYPGADAPSLNNVSLSIPAGSSIGIIGTTGAGKSTLMDLLLGLISPQEGQVLIDGRSLDQAQARGWRANVGYVPQDVFLSDATIAQNIAFAVPREAIDPQQVRRAARMAQIDRFIDEDLPEGYDTYVGERGVRLSGGQRQRISIARALYSSPQVIAFDEATSALDNSTEAQVMEQISNLAGSRTLIMVAHRLTSVRNCDVIILLDQGRVAQMGSFDEVVGSPDARPKLIGTDL